MFDPNTPLWKLTVSEFMELNQFLLPKALEPIQPETYFTTVEAAEYLRISISTMNRWKKTEYVQSDKKGGILRFKKSELDKVMNA